MPAASMDCQQQQLQQHVWQQVQALYLSQTLPYEAIIADYTACLQRNRELEVRCGVLNKEVDELREEAGQLNSRLGQFDELAAKDFATKAESYRVELQRANSELTGLLRDKSKAYEDLLAMQRRNASLLAAQAEAAEAAELAASEIAQLKQRLAEATAALDEERRAAALAAAEAEARIAGRAAAESEAERLRGEVAALDASLRQMMAREAERLDQINRMHEEMMDNAKRQQTEASAASQLMGLLTRVRRTGSTPADSPASTSRRSSSADTPQAAGAAAAAGGGAAGQQQHWASLKQKMGLPEGPLQLKERELPAAPTKSTQGHSGGVCSLAFQGHGHLVASCGLDKTAATWDLNTLSQDHTYQGVLGSVNDVAFTADGRRLLGAGGDKRLLVWNTATGQVAHTLTGHTNAVSCVSCSPMDESLAVSAGEDRCLKVWDLTRGYSSRSLPCTKMPTALCLSQDGCTIITGHLDGTLCLWDLRQSRAGSQPLAEVRDHSQAILCVTPTSHQDRLLTASRDNQLRVWDFRQLGPVQVLRGSHFTIGSIGSMGRSKCHAEMSADGRWVAAGAADGQVFVWDLTAAPGSAAAVKQLKHHKEAAVAAGWSSNCTQLVTADKTGVVAFWQCTE